MNDTLTYNSSIGSLIEPEVIAYSFNTPGWYVVFGLVVLFALVIGIIRYRKYKNNAYRREAVKQIETIIQQENNNTIYEINILLKIIALRLFGRRKVASLIGEEWFQFLNASMNIRGNIQEKQFEKFTNALYNPVTKLDKHSIEEFAEFANLWVKNHNANV